jgi:hypothetical protein
MSVIHSEKYVYRTVVVSLIQSRSGAMFNQEKLIVCSKHQRKRRELVQSEYAQIFTLCSHVTAISVHSSGAL